MSGDLSGHRRPKTPRSGFTLVELLVVMFLIAVISSITCIAIGKVITKSRRTRAESQIKSIQVALATYTSETRSFPRRAGPIDSTTMWRNDIAWLYAALSYKATPQLGGGPGHYPLDFHAENLAFAPYPEPPEVAPFTLSDLGEDRYRLDDEAFQKAHTPGNAPAKCVVFLDPWGNPYYYRDWSGVPAAVKAGAKRTMTVKYDDGSTATIVDRVRLGSAFEIWSFGENGINEWGQGDDIPN